MVGETKTQQRRTFLKAVGGAAALSTITGRLGSVQDEAVKIGVYGPLTGPVSNIGADMRKGATLAADQINENGPGPRMQLFFGDSESEPARGRSAVESLLDRQQVDIIAGGFHSDVSLAVIEVTSARNVPQMISNSVSGAINAKMKQQNMRNVFKMSPPSESYGLGWQQFIDELQQRGDGYFPFAEKRIAMIAETTSYGISVMDATVRYLERSGWNIISQDEVAVDETNFTSLLTRVRAANPDIVWAVQTSPSSGANLIKQFRQIGFQDTHFMHTFVPSDPETIRLAGGAANGVLWMANIDVIPRFAQEIGLTEAWRQQYGTEIPGSAGSLPYDNLQIIAKSLESIGSVSELNVDSWERAVINLESHQGSAGYYDFPQGEPFHQAEWGIETIPALGYQIVNQESGLVWPPRYNETNIDNSLYQ